MKRLAALLLATTLLSGPSQAQTNPAFLDALDQITVHLDQPSTPQDLQNKIKVTINGQAVPIARITPREPAQSPIEKGQVVLPGTIQSALGGNEWDPNGQITKMTPVRPGVYEFVAALPAGNYQYKVAVNGSWEENYGQNFAPGGENILLSVSRDNTIVRFVVDFNNKTIKDSINHQDIVPPTTVTKPTTAPSADQKFQSFAVHLARPVTGKQLHQPIQIQINNGPARPVLPREVLDHPRYLYQKSDLGPTYSLTSTTFKVWSPVSTQSTLLLYPSPTAQATRRIPMKLGANGVWYIQVQGNLHGTYYQYEFHRPHETLRAADIYAKAASRDSTRSLVLDLNQTNPQNWPPARPFTSRNQADAIIYEAHIRDLTVHPSSGVRPAYRGKYLGLSQESTTVPNTNTPSALQYIKSLGVTHLHLLPFQNFNPAHSDQYNWGYETTLFNVPEEQYSTRPQDPITTIRETKQMIAALQKNGLGVVLDVVYNHSVPSHGPESAFWATVPYYYFRTNDQGQVLNESGVGNALHDERPMVRKFIRESLVFWTDEYNLDGYRFDLLGMFTPDTVRDLTQAIRKANPAALVYGEPWTGGGPNRSPKGTLKGQRVAVFNDIFRNLLRGGLDQPTPGYIDGAPFDRPTFERSLLGSIDDFAASPQETVNYASAHDNLTLLDKITGANPAPDLETAKASLRLAGAAVLLSQGIPFLEGGVELGRTKGGNHNSYNAGDAANQFDWQRGLQFADVAAYYKGLIALRRAHPAFRLATADQVRQSMKVLPWHTLPAEVVAYELDGTLAKDPWSKIRVYFSNRQEPVQLTLPQGTWQIAVQGQTIDLQAKQPAPQAIVLPPLSTLVIVRKSPNGP